jgi:type I restriction enzyme, S subunit
VGKYQGYERYKESEVEWLGEIPEHWEVLQVKRITQAHKQGFYTNQSYVDEGVKLARITDIDDFANVFFEKMPFVEIDLKDEKAFEIKDGDFLFARSGTIGRFGIVREPERAIFASYLISFRFQNAFPEYLKFYFASGYFKESLISTLHGGANQNVHAENIKEQFLSLPPLDEQESIAHFLDRKTSQIDALIAKKAALLEKLDEKRTALISHAVTKGLDSSVPMKDSGVEWLGDIPEHWTVSKARFISSIFVPQRNKPELNSDEGLPWVTMDDMSSERIKETLFKVSDVAFKIAGSKMLKKNSVIASCIGNFGICAINDVDVIINQQLQAFIPFSTIAPEYLCEIVRISNDYFKMIATAATVVYVNQAGFANMPILLPPKEEQEEIINFIMLKRTKIDRQKAKVKEAIELLKEYRTALITNAVTGKIDVRQVARV